MKINKQARNNMDMKIKITMQVRNNLRESKVIEMLKKTSILLIKKA